MGKNFLHITKEGVGSASMGSAKVPEIRLSKGQVKGMYGKANFDEAISLDRKRAVFKRWGAK